MHIRPLHIGQGLNLDLELLSNVMGHTKRSRGTHDNIYFDDDSLFSQTLVYGGDVRVNGRKKYRAAMVGPDCVDLGDVLRVSHGYSHIISEKEGLLVISKTG